MKKQSYKWFKNRTISKNNFFFYWLAAFGVLFLVGCDNDSQYDMGYEAAWNGENAPSFWVSKKEKDGYEQGLDDVWMYDEGYDDGLNGKKPKYFNDDDYMDGYKNGKKDK